MIRRIALGCAAALGVLASFPSSAGSDEKIPSLPEPWLAKRLEEFKDLKFGFMVHFGAYSQWGCIESWPLVEEDTWARPDDLKPWIERNKDLKRFQRDYSALPTDLPSREVRSRSVGGSGQVHRHEVRRLHDEAPRRFLHVRYEADRLPIDVTPPVPSTPILRPTRCKAVFDAFRKEGFGIGVYFSKADWHHPDYWDPDRPHAQTRNLNYDTAAEAGEMADGSWISSTDRSRS